jgi:aconitate hydratase
MRARAGVPPRTMAQKILAGRSSGAQLVADGVDVCVDQVVLARAPVRVYAEALALGLGKTGAEVAIAYEGRCVTDAGVIDEGRAAFAEMLAHGILVARAGAGFAGPVHLERFASPGRLCLTDEPRLAGVGGIGMLTFVVPTHLLARALVRGSVTVRLPVSVQVLLTGRLRPFVCARDVGLELQRRGLGEVVRRVEETRGAPVVLEFAGPSARRLSIGERSVLAALGPYVGAAGALFVSDERTEVFLRDQRRSKAYRALLPDAGAPCEEVFNVDLGAVDPLLLDEAGTVRAVWDLAGQPVTQVLLGGDSGVTLRDLLAAAMLLKSKRAPQRLDFLLAVPSRQMLDVLARSGALADLIATGARLTEPDARVVSGGLYPAPHRGTALRTCDRETNLAPRRVASIVSAETLAYAVATGEVGDPRSFKRPVRVVVPRVLPTDDVLIARRLERRDIVLARPPTKVDRPAAPTWKTAQTLHLVQRGQLSQLSGLSPARSDSPGGDVSQNDPAGVAVVCSTLDEVRDLSGVASDVSGYVRAVLAPYIPSSLVGLFSAEGIAAIRMDEGNATDLKNEHTIAFPAPSDWPEWQSTPVSAGAVRLGLTWLARGAERAWATAGAPLGGRPGAKGGGPARASGDD